MARSLARCLWASCAALLAPQLLAQSYVFTTVAGAPSAGFVDGPGATSRFFLPEAITLDTDSNLYVADYFNSAVRKIAPDGTVTTIVGGPGTFGSTDGPSSVAELGMIFGIAVDSAKNVYVADSYTSTIRRITPAGVVSTFAGVAGRTGSVDGPRASAQFKSPIGIAFDGPGNLYVADQGNATIRKIAVDGTVSTLAGSAGVLGATDGAGNLARFRSPYGVATDVNGNVYVSDLRDNTIRKITVNGTVSTLAGLAGTTGTTDGTGALARFDRPTSLAVDYLGYVYVAEYGSHTIRAITPGGSVVTLTGQTRVRGSIDGPVSTARFSHPTGIAVNALSTALYVADTDNCTIRKVASNGTVTTLAGQAGSGSVDGMRAAARLFSPDGLAFDANGTLFICDTYNHTIRKMTTDGTVTTVAGSPGVQGTIDGTVADARFTYPEHLVVDAKGNIYLTDFSNATIRKITATGLVGTLAGRARTYGADDGTGSAARFDAPSGIAMDAAGNLVVSEFYNHTLRRITPEGVVTTIAGQAGVSGNADGPAALARFSYPQGLAYDAAGNLYIADSGNDTIRKLAPNGTVSTVAGVAGNTGFADGTGGAAQFDTPEGIAVDPQGNVLIADYGNDSIRKLTPAGVVTTIGGYQTLGFDDGVGDNAGFWKPSAVATDAYGNVYVADSLNHTIRKGGQVGVNVPTSRLSNLSVRANLVANQRLITGFVVTGGTKPILVRAIGPGLVPYVGGAVTASDPRIEMYNNALDLVQSNEDWGGTGVLIEAFNAVGAFPLPNGSRDAAALRSIEGLQTVHTLSPAGGLAVVEAYDTGSGTSARLINVSARYPVSGGAGALIAGFSIDGAGPKTLLIRGVGPTLKSFGISTALTDPQLELYNSAQQKISENDNWYPTLSSTFNRVSAFDFVSGSKDSALLISLSPGIYSAVLRGANNGTGEGVIEIYEVGN